MKDSSNTHQLLGRFKHGVQCNDSEMYWEKCKETAWNFYNSSTVVSNTVTAADMYFFFYPGRHNIIFKVSNDKIRVRQKLLTAGLSCIH